MYIAEKYREQNQHDIVQSRTNMLFISVMQGKKCVFTFTSSPAPWFAPSNDGSCKDKVDLQTPATILGCRASDWYRFPIQQRKSDGHCRCETNLLQNPGLVGGNVRISNLVKPKPLDEALPEAATYHYITYYDYVCISIYIYT